MYKTKKGMYKLLYGEYNIDTFKNKILLVILLSCFLSVQTVYGHTGYFAKPVSVEISSPKTVIDIGEPLILKLTYKLEEPPRETETDNILSRISLSSVLLIELKDTDNDWLKNYPDFNSFDFKKDGVQYYPLELQHLHLHAQDAQGLEYTGYFLVLYNHYKKDLTFDKTGNYKICTLTSSDKIFSNFIDLQVTTQMEEEKCALLDQSSCDFLMGIDRKLFDDPNYRSKIKRNLKGIVDHCQNNLLSQLAAARLGIESLKDYEADRSSARSENRESSKQLFQEAHCYLTSGLNLPDDFPLRQEILYRLIEIELESKNFTQAISYSNELCIKYPKGKYGKQAVKMKVELKKLKQREEAKAN